MRRSQVSAIIFAATLILPSSVQAEVSGSVDLVSDYRFRGVSQSGNTPAAQATIRITQGAFFGEGFVTSLGRDSYGGSVETDITFGGTKKLGKSTLTLSGTWYLYPDAHGGNVFEMAGRVDRPVGPFTFSLSADYAPSQHNLDHRDSLYLGLNASLPIGKPELFAGIGRERGGLAPGGKIDWQLGAQMSLHGF